ncbi:MAG: DMT family transporter [Hyphomicrobiaceae bacterium]|nr:DMT family transporter [Hyphomicrobiaceae bacterium]
MDISLISGSALGATLALASAVSWGGADFSGGLGVKGANAALVVAVSQAAGLLCLIAMLLMVDEPLPSSSALAWGVGAGLGVGLGNYCLYSALAIGKMGINAPVAAIVSSTLVTLLAIWHDGLPAPVQIGGFALAAVAIWLMTTSDGETKGLGLAFGAGLAFTAYLYCSKHATADGIFWPLIAGRFVALFVFTGIALRSRADFSSVSSTSVRYMLAAGVLDAIANILFVFATRYTRMDEATFLSSLYPGITVLCAWLILSERVSRRQGVGIAVALLAIPLIALH